MLSRVAERIYWMSRYLERVENTARLVSVYSQLLLDLPAEAGLDWGTPLQILGVGDAYRSAPGNQEELEYLLTGHTNVASLLASVGQARENARTTRDVVPSEAWQAINELQLFAEGRLGAVRQGRGSGVPADIVRRCHEITGILEGGMSHGPAYQFVRLGRSLERADMTSRMIDVAAAIMMAGREELEHHGNTIWRAVLRALSAYQMYRQFVRRRITGVDVLRFLLHDCNFPRSVTFCVTQLDDAAAALPRHEATRNKVSKLRAEVTAMDPESQNYETVHHYIDELQVEFAGLHDLMFETWLNPIRMTRSA
jgi:uncharacterized alpha-E superfamily protein